jgi:hypothetical protein
MNTDTPETDHLESNLGNAAHPILSFFCRKLERQRDEWKAKFIQQNKDLGCEMMDPNGTIWDYAKKLQTELPAVTKQLTAAREELKAVTEQRDKLAELSGFGEFDKQTELTER